MSLGLLYEPLQEKGRIALHHARTPHIEERSIVAMQSHFLISKQNKYCPFTPCIIFQVCSHSVKRISLRIRIRQNWAASRKVKAPGSDMIPQVKTLFATCNTSDTEERKMKVSKWSGMNNNVAQLNFFCMSFFVTIPVMDQHALFECSAWIIPPPHRYVF